MKKRYTRPELIYESFRFLDSVAVSNCAINLNHDPIFDCAYQDENGIPWFTKQTNSACEEEINPTVEGAHLIVMS